MSEEREHAARSSEQRPAEDDGGRESEPARDDLESPYRGSGSDFDEAVYPRSYRTPGRINLKKAMNEYVQGHDRGWDQETKARMADEALEAGGSGKGYLGPGQAVASGELTLRVGGESSTEAAAGLDEVEGGPRYGVGVPKQLEYHRGADTWRDRVRELIHGAVEEAADEAG